MIYDSCEEPKYVSIARCLCEEKPIPYGSLKKFHKTNLLLLFENHQICKN